LVRLTQLPQKTRKTGLHLGWHEGREITSPFEHELKLKHISAAVDHAFIRCRDTARHTDISIRCWLRSLHLDCPCKTLAKVRLYAAENLVYRKRPIRSQAPRTFPYHILSRTKHDGKSLLLKLVVDLSCCSHNAASIAVLDLSDILARWGFRPVEPDFISHD
jgi:hypothetical protein